jgi:hypothetical protein
MPKVAMLDVNQAIAVRNATPPRPAGPSVRATMMTLTKPRTATVTFVAYVEATAEKKDGRLVPVRSPPRMPPTIW